MIKPENAEMPPVTIERIRLMGVNLAGEGTTCELHSHTHGSAPLSYLI
jgi:hypothetical protein